MKLGELIREKREEKKMTLEDLAKVTKFSEDHLGRIERNEAKNPGLITLKKISEALDLDLKDLIEAA